MSAPLVYAVMVNEGPYTHQASDTAYQFVRAALGQGHRVERVFFYHDGVNNGTAFTTPPADDRDVVRRWSELAAAHGIDLAVCVAAAQRRGIVDAGEARRHRKPCANLAAGFRIAGLGQLVEAAIVADRVVEFGD